MNSSFWRSVALLCLIQGLATAINPSLGMSAGLFVGIFLAARWWFVDYPAIWWYDLLFWLLILGVALVAASIYTGICAILSFASVTTRVCQSLGLARAFALHVWVLGLVGAIFWLWHLWIWWKLRR
jgi:hypothetical protein